MEDFNNDSFLSEESFMEEGDFIGVDDGEIAEDDEGELSDGEDDEEIMDFESEDEY